MKWVKHDTDANLDAKLQNVLLDYGLEGYGLYWYCIELIAGNITKDNITFELEHDARIIARNTGNTRQKVEEMMRYFVEQGLFEQSGNTISCFKIARRLDKSMTSNPEMRAIIESLKESHAALESKKNHDPIMTKSENVMQEEIRTRLELDKTRQEKEMGAKHAPAKRKRFTPPTSQEVSDYFFEKCGDSSDAESFINFYESKGWLVGKAKMKDWQAAVRGWIARNKKRPEAKQAKSDRFYDELQSMRFEE